MQPNTEFNLYYILPILAAMASAISFIYLHELRGMFKEIVVLEYAYSTQMITSSVLLQLFQQRQSNDASNFNSLLVAVLLSVIVLLAYSSNYFRIKSIFLKKPS